MAQHITETAANGKTYCISYSDLDLEGESDQLYWDRSKVSRMFKMPYGYKLRKGEILDANGKRMSTYDLGDVIASLL